MAKSTTAKSARESAAEEFSKKRDAALSLLDEYGRAIAVYTAPDSTDDDRANAKEAMVEMADDLEEVYAFYKHQCEHRASLGRNPHTDTELGELKHEKGRAHKAWQGALSHLPPPPTPQQILDNAAAEAQKQKEAKAERRRLKAERQGSEQE